MEEYLSGREESEGVVVNGLGKESNIRSEGSSGYGTSLRNDEVAPIRACNQDTTQSDMARTSRRSFGVLALLALLASFANAQLSNVPNLPDGSSSAAPKKTGNGNNNNNNNGASKTVAHLTGLPTIPGAGIPSLIIPETANAPFMQKSSLPEGTFFIAVGATLAFLGACVLLWRAMVAWSINRSVKRTAMASVGTRSEKTGSTMYGAWGGSRKSAGFNAISKSGFYKDSEVSVSMENLTATGKQVRPQTSDRSSTLPQDLFFSPTAHARDSKSADSRISGYMPAGFYANSAAQPAGGAPNAIIGGSLAPYAQQHKRQSTQGSHMSRGSELGTPLQTSRDSTTLRGVSRDGPLNSRDGGFRMQSRDSRPNYLYANPSSSSLMVGQSSNGSDTTPSRAPSAYLEDLFENHGNGPRERF